MARLNLKKFVEKLSAAVTWSRGQLPTIDGVKAQELPRDEVREGGNGWILRSIRKYSHFLQELA